MTPIQNAMVKAGLVNTSDIEIIISEDRERSKFNLVDFENKIKEYAETQEESSEEKRDEHFQCLACGRPSKEGIPCAYCGGDVVEIKNIPKIKGHMVWTYNPKPTSQFEE